MTPLVSVPLRGKEGAGRSDLLSEKDCLLYLMFPSPCGVRRVRDTRSLRGTYRANPFGVSVPLRGKEGAGPPASSFRQPLDSGEVSVPLRGKEGAGPNSKRRGIVKVSNVSVPLRGKEGAGPLVFGNFI